MSNLFNQLLLTPFFSVLVFFYNTVAFGDFGVAIIMLTFLVRLVLSPLSYKALRSQKEMQELQPKLKELQEKYKNDKQALAQATMDLYKLHKVNPFSGCLPLLIQLPILIALYQVSIKGFSSEMLARVYSFIDQPDQINSISLGFIDLTKKSWGLAIIAGFSQFIQSKLSLTKSVKIKEGGQKDQVKSKESALDMQNMMQKQMLYFFPILTIVMSTSFPAGLPLYWIATTLFSIGETLLMKRRTRK
ncbi:MAG: membrane protein insertase YidC [Parcubacteria group bacterium]|nr:membrane protein insertase YidC [Parcubacteria group bacterium]